MLYIYWRLIMSVQNMWAHKIELETVGGAYASPD